MEQTLSVIGVRSQVFGHTALQTKDPGSNMAISRKTAADLEAIFENERFVFLQFKSRCGPWKGRIEKREVRIVHGVGRVIGIGRFSKTARPTHDRRRSVASQRGA